MAFFSCLSFFKSRPIIVCYIVCLIAIMFFVDDDDEVKTNKTNVAYAALPSTAKYRIATCFGPLTPTFNLSSSTGPTSKWCTYAL